MRKFASSLLVAGLLATFAAGEARAASAYKCRLPDGTWLFSEAPCGTNAEKFELELAPSIGHIPVPEPSSYPEEPVELGGPPASFDSEREDSAATYSALELENLARKKRVVVGMSAEQVREAWGDPLNVVHEVHQFGVTEVWEYEAGGTVTKTVILINNRVISVDIDRW